MEPKKHAQHRLINLLNRPSVLMFAIGPQDTQPYPYLQIVCVALDRVVLFRSFLSDELMTSYVELAKIFSWWHLRICFIFHHPLVLANCPGCPVGLPSHDIDKYQATGLHGTVGLDKFYRYYSTASHDFAEKKWSGCGFILVVFFKVMFLPLENRINFPKKCQKR